MDNRNEKWKTVLFGSMGVAVECLHWLLEQPEFDVIGVVCSREPRSKWREKINDKDMQEEAKRLSIPLLALDDVLRLEADIGLSVRFHQILKRSHLSRFRKGVINLHGAPLPEYRGSMGDAMAILEGRDHFGVDLHWMDEGIDTGDIIASERFPISKTSTVYDLFVLGNSVGLQLIQSTICEVMKDNVLYETQKIVSETMNVPARTFSKKDVIPYKRIDGAMSPERIWDAVRAFQFPGQEPAYMETAAGKIYLSIGNSDDKMMEGTHEDIGAGKQ
jgi:methionyl-tRNA formyltransferase